MLTSATLLLLLVPAMDERGPEVTRYEAIITEDAPVAWWRFGSGDSGEEWPYQIHGDVKLDPSGPRPPLFPAFTDANEAVEFPQRGGWLSVTDPGDNSLLDFDLGDSITLEAWVAPDGLPNGQYGYIIGKGRTYREGFDKENHNYALRLQGKGSGCAISFLFRSAGENSDYHRWTSTESIGMGDGWHHVAVAYEFGQKGSLRAWLDGEPVKGKWDLGGDTDRRPVVDNDELWIGSAMGGNKSSTFSGGLDEIAIYRRRLEDDEIRRHYVYKPGEFGVVENPPGEHVLVQIFEGVADRKSWSFRPPTLTDEYTSPAFAFTRLPRKYTSRGVIDDRSNPFLLRATARIILPDGPFRWLVRGRNSSRLFVDNQQIAETAFYSINSDGHGQVLPLDVSAGPDVKPLPRGDSQAIVEAIGDGQEHIVRYELLVGGGGHRPEPGDAMVAIAEDESQLFQVVGHHHFEVSPAGVMAWQSLESQLLSDRDAQMRRQVSTEEQAYWDHRHALAREWISAHPLSETPEATIDELLSIGTAAGRKTSAANPSSPLPQRGERVRVRGALSDESSPVPQPGETARANGPACDDATFLRRAALATIGIVPTRDLIDRFAELQYDRTAIIDELLASPGWADHQMGYWQDVLAENPNIINPTLNNTGPFRWWLHESFLDNKPFDRFATELILMEGSQHQGGPAGFATATQNDVPMAAKANILSQAFLGVQMGCARCHDAPAHDVKQEDLFAAAAMLQRSGIRIPASSSVPIDPDAEHQPAVTLSLHPGDTVDPKWSFTSLIADDPLAELLRNKDDSRERFAVLVASPRNTRFAQVAVNRMWQRLFGWALVEPVEDWENVTPRHEAVLNTLAGQFVRDAYDLKALARRIMTSQAWQQEAIRTRAEIESRVAPLAHSMSAEQLVDSMFAISGKRFNAGYMSVDADGGRINNISMNLGEPRRAWMFASLSNERDRPALALPYAQPFVTFLETWGWRGSRQNPVHVRELELTALQPGQFANSVLAQRLTRLSDDHALLAVCVNANDVRSLADETVRRMLSRAPTPDEYRMFEELLSDEFETRVDAERPDAERPGLSERTGLLPAPTPVILEDGTEIVPQPGLINWSNHLHPKATEIQQRLEDVVQRGEAPTKRLNADWRERYEDMLWTLINSPEFVMVP